MSYNPGKRGFEYAAKSNHSFIIKDKAVQDFLQQCDFPKEGEQVEIDDNLIIQIENLKNNPIEHIVAIDGGDSTVDVKKKFPSAKITFFQFGASYLSLSDLKEVHEMAFISPKAMSKLKDLQRIKLVLPTKNVGLKIKNSDARETITNSVRKSFYDFFQREGYLESLYWFLFEMYDQKLDSYHSGANCPICSKPYGNIIRKKVNSHYSFKCQSCNENLALTDAFRLHEAIDDDLGAGGVIGYVRNLVEHFILIHTIKGVLENNPQALKKVMFLKDGPLGFFGQTANMHAPMRNLVTYAFKNHSLFLAGIEKSGPFVEHALEIFDHLKPSSAVLLNNNHIYTYIKMGDPKTKDPFGRTSYYGSKVIFKSSDERMYVVTIPTESAEVVLNPSKKDFHNLNTVLKNIEKLKCDMYDNSLLPIALANKLVSISDHPSSALLEKFAKKEIRKSSK